MSENECVLKYSTAWNVYIKYKRQINGKRMKIKIDEGKTKKLIYSHFTQSRTHNSAGITSIEQRKQIITEEKNILIIRQVCHHMLFNFSQMFVGSRRFESICIAFGFITGADYIILSYLHRYVSIWH